MNYAAQLTTLLLYSLVLLLQNAPPPATSQRSETSDAKSSNENPSEDFGSLDGTWEGDLTFLQGATLSQKTPSTGRYRITLQGTDAHVCVIRSGDVKEIKPGKFRMEHLMTNAVIFATDSGRDDEGTWVETWVFALTQKDKDTLLTNFSRVVNNIDLPLARDHSKFAKEAAGELKRAADDTCPQYQRPPTTSDSQSKSSTSDGHEPPSPSQVPAKPLGVFRVSKCGPEDPRPCVKAPRAIFAPEPEFTEQARKANYAGVCLIGLIVGTDGVPSNIRVLKGLGMGLDEKAVEAIRTWRFEPAMRFDRDKKDGYPVRVEIAVEVDFHFNKNKSSNEAPQP